MDLFEKKKKKGKDKDSTIEEITEATLGLAVTGAAVNVIKKL